MLVIYSHVVCTFCYFLFIFDLFTKACYIWKDTSCPGLESAASGQGSSPRMMAPGSTRYRGAQQQNMFGTWHVQPMHAHKHTCVYTTTVLTVFIWTCIFINWRQLNNSMDKKSRRWLGICLFVLGFLGHINFQYPEFGKTLFLHLNRQKESLLQTWWPFRSRHLDGFIAWISLAFSIPRLQPLDQVSCSLHLLQGFWTQAEGKGRTRNAPKYQTTWKYGEF